MKSGPGRLYEKLVFRGILRRWKKTARRAQSVDLSTLRSIRTRARELRRQIDKVLHVADARLTLPLISSNAMQPPLHSDWAWRPELWRGPLNPTGMAAVRSKATLGDEVTIFHDCRISELTLRQIRNTQEEDLAPFGLRMDVFRFDGSFLSLAINLPNQAVSGLGRNHIVRLSTVVQMEKPLEIFARLNIRHGPNTEQVVRELPRDSGEVAVDFDLAYTKLNEKRVDSMWVDLIFEGPEMNQITLRDATFSRRPRAEL
ncbi:DUF6478 family protein [Aliiroseovarius sp. PTFE2010]|uniref:DUF6478 family protein n=1 Tax=Aliiroseovarius sp. PTFE2010 TaxID=3417190 RepID=UPI003CFAB9AC